MAFSWRPARTLTLALPVVWAAGMTRAFGYERELPAPAARRYRELTKHSPQTIGRSGHRLDWSNVPSLYKHYPGAEAVSLPPPLSLERPALDATGVPLPATVEAAPQLNLAQLGTILFLSGGITGRRPSSGGEIRATASAGGLYPNELYVVCGDLPELPAGVYHYDPEGACLIRLRKGDWRSFLADAAGDERIGRVSATLVLTGILWRSAWKYEERAYRHLYWDGGMKLAHVLAAAVALQQPAFVLAAFIDREVDRLLGIDGRREFSLALVPLGAPGAPAAPSPSQEVPPLELTPTALSARPIDYPEALRYHAASSLETAEAVQELRSRRTAERAITPRPDAAITLPPAASAHEASLDSVVRRRRSTRHFARRFISAAELAAGLHYPSRDVPADFLGPRSTLLETYLVVHTVQGIQPGAYYYHRNSHRLERLHAGDLRAEAGYLCLWQDLAADASAVVFYLVDLERVLRTFGERGYRLAELEAGLAAGRSYLAAYALGRGATGLTFFDDEVTALFSPHARGLESLLVVAIGQPAGRSIHRP